MSREQRAKDEINRGSSSNLTLLSLVSILLTFFIYLNSKIPENQLRSAEVSHSVQESFHGSKVEAISPRTILKLSKEAGFDARREFSRYVISIPGATLFESGEADIKPEIIPALETIGRLVQRFDLNVTIEGHTDSKPIRTNRFRSNWELSTARAVAVLRLLLGIGINANRLSAAGRGEFIPIATNDTDVGRGLNRRVVLIVEEANSGDPNAKSSL